MPPPAPIKPQMKPTKAPHRADFAIRAFFDPFAISSLVVMTGRIMNFMPKSMVMKTEKLPMVADGTRLET